MAGFLDDVDIESFDNSPDGTRIMLSFLETSRRLTLAEEVHGVVAPRSDR